MRHTQQRGNAADQLGDALEQPYPPCVYWSQSDSSALDIRVFR